MQYMHFIKKNFVFVTLIFTQVLLLVFFFLSISLFCISVYLWYATVITYWLYKKMQNESNSRAGVVYQAETVPQYQSNIQPKYPTMQPQYPD